ncbi:MAG: transporter [Proteobacteria bacterium]|nr:transporter [Pseudomonadota bacterium]
MRITAALAALIVAVPAAAQDKLRDYCPDRPGIGTPACITDAGHVSVESALVDWTLDKEAGGRTDTVVIGDTLVRIGLTDTIEAQVDWTPVGFVRGRAGGAVSRAARVGDVTLGLRANLAGPDGKGLSVALQPFVTLPVGRAPVGAGDWGAGLVVPVTYDLSDKVNVQFAPETDAAVDQDGRGRHLAVSAVVGIGYALTDRLALEAEGEVKRDDDPAGAATRERAGLSLAYKANDNLQLDVGGVAGLSRNAPDVELYAGISRRF